MAIHSHFAVKENRKEEHRMSNKELMNVEGQRSPSEIRPLHDSKFLVRYSNFLCCEIRIFVHGYVLASPRNTRARESCVDVFRTRFGPPAVTA
jgi:hypothetical protein